MRPNKDLMFAEWYDSLEGTKSQGFAYKAWSAGWVAASAAAGSAASDAAIEQQKETK